MDYKSNIEDSIKQSLKQRDSVRLSVLRMLLAAIKNKEVEKLRALTEDEFFSIVKTSVKQHVDSMESFKKGNRQDLVDKEEKELEILKTFLPVSLSSEELMKEVEETIKIIEAKSKKDMGKVIKYLMEKYPGRIDGKELSGMIIKKLSSL